MKQTRKDEKISGKITNQTYSEILFDGLIVRNARISKTRFSNIHFKNSYLGQSSEYVDCEFKNCKFFGKYSTLGFSTKYKNCNFLDCEFIGTTLFEAALFSNCIFSGKIKNAIIKDRKQKLFKKIVVFDHCDLSNIVFDNLSLYGKFGFENCVLPSKGIIKYKNENDSLIDRAAEICSKIDNSSKTESEVIFMKKLKSGQNPIILDKLFLDSFFPTDDSRRIFDTIVTGYEIEE